MSAVYTYLSLTREQIELYERFVRAQRHVFSERLRPGTIISYVDRETSPMVWSCRFCGNEWSTKEVPSRCRTCGAPKGY